MEKLIKIIIKSGKIKKKIWNFFSKNSNISKFSKKLLKIKKIQMIEYLFNLYQLGGYCYGTLNVSF